MTRKYTKKAKSAEIHLVDEKKNGKKKRITINLDKYPELYNRLTELSHTNVRTVEQQTLFYIMQAVGETEVKVKENDKCE